jgi:hypothetical protein
MKQNRQRVNIFWGRTEDHAEQDSRPVRHLQDSTVQADGVRKED